MKNTILKTAAAMAILLVGAQGASAQANISAHTVTVDVQAINVLAVSGTFTMTISTATAGSDPTAATDNTARYAFTTNSSVAKKITASISPALPTGMTLSVDATAGGGGTSAGPVSLSGTAADLVSGLTQTKASNLALTYSAGATAETPVASTPFTVTYTLTN